MERNVYSISQHAIKKDEFIGLFDEAFYIKQLKKFNIKAPDRINFPYMDSKSSQLLLQAKEFGFSDIKLSLLAHYLSVGWIKGLSPNWLFDPSFIEKNHNLRGPVHNIYRFCLEGQYFSWDSHPYFSSRFYKKSYLDANYSLHPLVHYLTQGASQGNAPHILFDPNWYAETYRTNKCGALLEFALAGKTTRDPSPLFSSSYLLNQKNYTDADLTALEYYIRTGDESGLAPHELFDPFYFRSHHNGAISKVSYLDYLQQFGLDETEPHSQFFSGWYRQQIGAEKELYNGSMLHHYLYYGAKERRQINPYLTVLPNAVVGNNNNNQVCKKIFRFRDLQYCPIVKFELLSNELKKISGLDADLSRAYAELHNGMKILSIDSGDIIQRSVVEALKAVSSYQNIVITFDALERNEVRDSIELIRSISVAGDSDILPTAVLGSSIREDQLPLGYRPYCVGHQFSRLSSTDTHALAEVVKSVVFSMEMHNAVFILSDRSTVFLDRYLRQLCKHLNVIFYIPSQYDDLAVAAFIAEKANQTMLRIRIACHHGGIVANQLNNNRDKLKSVSSGNLTPFWQIFEVK